MKIRIPVFLLVLLYVINSSGYSYANEDYTIVFLNKNPDKELISDEEIKKLQEGHLANIERLMKAGKMLSAGPFDGGGGLFIFKTDLNETDKLLKTDPAIQAGRFMLEVYRFKIIRGRICQVSDSAEMVSYSFVRIFLSGEKYDEDLSMHDAYFANNFTDAELLCEGQFTDHPGRFLIFKDIQSSESILQDDPLMHAKHTEHYIKSLYIGLGAFCE